MRAYELYLKGRGLVATRRPAEILEGIDSLAQALEIDAQNVEALSVLAIVYNELDIDPARAIELLERAIDLNPGSLVANNFLGDVYFRIADMDKALREKDGRWTYPLFIRLPGQAPDSEPWQEFWHQPGPKRVAELRQANGFSPQAPTFGVGANP